PGIISTPSKVGSGIESALFNTSLVFIPDLTCPPFSGAWRRVALGAGGGGGRPRRSGVSKDRAGRCRTPLPAQSPSPVYSSRPPQTGGAEAAGRRRGRLSNDRAEPPHTPVMGPFCGAAGRWSEGVPPQFFLPGGWVGKEPFDSQKEEHNVRKGDGEGAAHRSARQHAETTRLE